MPPRKPKVRPKRPPIVDDRRRFRALYRKYTIERLIQWYEEDRRSPPQRGRVPFSWLMPLSEPVRAKTVAEAIAEAKAIAPIADRMPNPARFKTKPPRRKARKKI
jgi:hypothetical protein